MSTFKIFIVEDDPWYGEILKYHLELNPEYEIHLFENAKDCLKKLHQKPDVITIDYSLPDMDGGELLEEVLRQYPNLPVIVISGQEEVEVAISLIKKGAYDYILKDDNTKELLWNSLLKSRETQSLKKEVETLKNELIGNYNFDKTVIGNSPSIKRIFGLLEKASSSNINVSIMGETGTGKEVVAKAIHYNSARKKKPFVPVNMAAIPSELIESELFGHEKGAFTGAVSRKKGKFEEANGGTIFLDEIGELALHLQSKLLRVLQERELIRVGGNEKVKLDVKILTATHVNLSEQVEKGKFREDLFYRILGLPIELPPLRERGNDILLLAKHFSDQFANENKSKKFKISEEAGKKLMDYQFPGNVRELKASVDLACVLCTDNEITPSDLQFHTPRKKMDFLNDNLTLREYTINVVQHALDKNRADVIKTAKKLDIGKSTIYKMIKDQEVFLNKD